MFVFSLILYMCLDVIEYYIFYLVYGWKLVQHRLKYKIETSTKPVDTLFSYPPSSSSSISFKLEPASVNPLTEESIKFYSNLIESYLYYLLPVQLSQRHTELHDHLESISHSLTENIFTQHQ
jgi:hypothetical protein